MKGNGKKWIIDKKKNKERHYINREDEGEKEVKKRKQKMGKANKSYRQGRTNNDQKRIKQDGQKDVQREA